MGRYYVLNRIGKAPGVVDGAGESSRPRAERRAAALRSKRRAVCRQPTEGRDRQTDKLAISERNGGRALSAETRARHSKGRRRDRRGTSPLVRQLFPTSPGSRDKSLFRGCPWLAAGESNQQRRVCICPPWIWIMSASTADPGRRACLLAGICHSTVSGLARRVHATPVIPKRRGPSPAGESAFQETGRCLCTVVSSMSPTHAQGDRPTASRLQTHARGEPQLCTANIRRAPRANIRGHAAVRLSRLGML